MADARLLYKNDVDFTALALQSPPFNKYLKSNGQLDFSDPDAVQQLTKSLLKRDFGLEVDLPGDRLCPPVPNRMNYILWIQDLLDTSNDSYTDRYDPQREVVGLDIGTGASCIYPLLGCALRPKWRFVATDIDDKNMEYARKNIIHNKLQDRIRPRLTTQKDSLIGLDGFGLQTIDFTICNPPFYSSPAELLASAKAKSRPPHSACTGAVVEVVTPGGEVAFIRRMINESIALKTKCQWYTSMLGKLHSVPLIVETLRNAGVRNWCVKEFVQGEKTRRWAIAWSWSPFRPAQSVVRGIPGLPKHLLPFPVEYGFTLPLPSLEITSSRLNAIFNSFNMQWQYRPSLATGIGFANENVWSRSARRRLRQGDRKGTSDTRQRHGDDKEDENNEEQDEDEDEDEAKTPQLGFKIKLSPTPTQDDDDDDDEKNSIKILIRWIIGNDSVLFESFCGMLRNQMMTIPQQQQR